MLRLAAALALALALATVARADAPAPPADVQAILDKARRGVAPTAAEQERLRAWQMQSVRQADPAYQRGADSSRAATTGMPDDVRDIMARMQRGVAPTAAEQARLRAWAEGMKQHQGDISRDVRDAATRGHAAASAGGFDARVQKTAIEGVVVVDVAQKQSGKHGTMSASGTVSVPVLYTLKQEDAGKGRHAVWLGFRVDPKRAVHGSVHMTKHEDENDRIADGTYDTSLDGGGMSMFAGELYADPRRPRSYLRVVAALLGQMRGRQTEKRGGETHTSNVATPGAAIPLPLAWDEFRQDVPWVMGTADGIATAGVPPPPPVALMRGKIAPEIVAASDGSTFSVDGNALAAGLAAGQPFRTVGTFSWHQDKGDGNDRSRMESTATIRFAIEPPPSDLVIAPADDVAWRKWMPLPWLANGDDATIYGVRAKDPSVAVTVHVGFGNRSAGKKCKFEIALTDVSETKGWSTNYPKQADGPHKSLFMLPDQDGLEIESNRQRAHARNEVDGIDIKLAADDTGAWGRVTARCPSDGAVAQNPATGLGYVKLPRDDDDNHVADQYQEDKQVGPGQPALWDEDPRPAGQRRDGDGYTLYEEYRGFVVLEASGSKTRRFLRTSPLDKDLFVYDRDGLFKTYYERWNPSQLTIHYVDRSMMQYEAFRELPGQTGAPSLEHRWINFNTRADQRYARQFVAVVLHDKTHDSQGQAMTYDGAAGDAFRHPMRLFAETRVNPELDFQRLKEMLEANGVHLDDKTLGAMSFNEMASTVMHELGHQIGIMHHQAQAGAQYPPTPPQQPGAPEPTPTTAFYGVWHCPMRYPAAAEDLQAARHGAWPLQTKYCRLGDRGQYEAAGRGGEVTFLPSKDDCWHQIDVKNDP